MANVLNKHCESHTSKFLCNGLNNFQITNNGTNFLIRQKKTYKSANEEFYGGETKKSGCFITSSWCIHPILQADQGFNYLRVKMAAKRVNYTAANTECRFRRNGWDSNNHQITSYLWENRKFLNLVLPPYQDIKLTTTSHIWICNVFIQVIWFIPISIWCLIYLSSSLS